jgi:hypothetical protein
MSVADVAESDYGETPEALAYTIDHSSGQGLDEGQICVWVRFHANTPLRSSGYWRRM